MRGLGGGRAGRARSSTTPPLGRCQRRRVRRTIPRASRRGCGGARQCAGARLAPSPGGAAPRMPSGAPPSLPVHQQYRSPSPNASSLVGVTSSHGESGVLAPPALPHPHAELASRAQTEVEESGGTIKAVHPSRKGLDIAVRLARLREAASSTPVPTPTKATSADPSRRTQRAATGDGASSEGYSADFASESAGEPPSDTKNAAAAVAAIAPPQVRGYPNL